MPTTLDRDTVEFIEQARLLSLLEDLRYVFDSHFDRSWIATVIDALPLDRSTLRGIRDLSRISYLYPGVESTIKSGLDDLSVFTTELRRHLLPYLKERMRISPLQPSSRVRDKDLQIYRQFASYTLPTNVERLEDLGRRIRDALSA